MKYPFLKVVFLLTIILGSCSKKGDAAHFFEGKWKAQWITSKEAFPDVESQVFLKMNGLVEFSGDEVTITAYGYPNCIFSADTLQHSQKWALRGDTLELLNTGDLPGISYIVRKKTDNYVQLVLMGDIFVNLTR